MKTETLNALKSAALEDAACFVDEMPGEQLNDTDDWDSAAFGMRQNLNIDGAFEIYRKHLVVEINRLNGLLDK